MSGGDDKSKGDGKGFSGLSSLITDNESASPADSRPVESPKPTTAPSTPNPEQRQAPPSPSPQAATPPSPQPQVRQPQPPQSSSPQQAKPNSSSNAWIIWLLVIGGVIWAIAASDNKPKVPTRPVETKPSVGRNLVLSYNELHYCLAEDIRMEGAKSVLNNYSDADINRFNAMVADYNSRCGEFKYRQGSLEGARRDIDPWRSQIYAEGQSLFSSRQSNQFDQSVVPSAAQSPPAKPAPATQQQGPWNDYAPSQSAPTVTSQANAQAAAQAAWESVLAAWAQRNASFLADPNRHQAFANALDQVNKETNGTLSDSDLITTAYRRAAISTGWLTEIPSTPDGKPIQYPGTVYSGIPAGSSQKPSARKTSNSSSTPRCPSGTQWVSDEQKCCERYVYVKSGTNYLSEEGMRWVGCSAPQSLAQTDTTSQARAEAERACSSFRDFGNPGDFESCVSNELRKRH